MNFALARNQRNKSPCLVVLTASAPNRGKGALAVIWNCSVIVFEGASVPIHLKARDWALGVAWGDEPGAPFDEKPRTSRQRPFFEPQEG